MGSEDINPFTGDMKDIYFCASGNVQYFGTLTKTTVNNVTCHHHFEIEYIIAISNISRNHFAKHTHRSYFTRLSRLSRFFDAIASPSSLTVPLSVSRSVIVSSVMLLHLWALWACFQVYEQFSRGVPSGMQIGRETWTRVAKLGKLAFSHKVWLVFGLSAI